MTSSREKVRCKKFGIVKRGGYRASSADVVAVDTNLCGRSEEDSLLRLSG